MTRPRIRSISCDGDRERARSDRLTSGEVDVARKAFDNAPEPAHDDTHDVE